jgi:hypothetical protein
MNEVQMNMNVDDFDRIKAMIDEFIEGEFTSKWNRTLRISFLVNEDDYRRNAAIDDNKLLAGLYWIQPD